MYINSYEQSSKFPYRFCHTMKLDKKRKIQISFLQGLHIPGKTTKHLIYWYKYRSIWHDNRTKFSNPWPLPSQSSSSSSTRSSLSSSDERLSTALLYLSSLPRVFLFCPTQGLPSSIISLGSPLMTNDFRDLHGLLLYSSIL